MQQMAPNPLVFALSMTSMSFLGQSILIIGCNDIWTSKNLSGGTNSQQTSLNDILPRRSITQCYLNAMRLYFWTLRIGRPHVVPMLFSCRSLSYPIFAELNRLNVSMPYCRWKFAGKKNLQKFETRGVRCTVVGGIKANKLSTILPWVLLSSEGPGLTHPTDWKGKLVDKKMMAFMQWQSSVLERSVHVPLAQPKVQAKNSDDG